MTRNRTHWLKLAAMALMALLIVFAVPGCRPDPAWGVELDQPLHVTLIPGIQDYLADLQTANVVADIYKVADLVPMDGIDSFTFSNTERFGDIDLSRIQTKEDWLQVTDDAFDLAKKDSEEPDLTIPPNQELFINPGVYLFVARSEDLKTAKQYIDTITDDKGVKTEVTVAQTEQYRYLYAPQIVVLPYRESPEDDVLSTASRTDWDYYPHVKMKPNREYRAGDLIIKKNLLDLGFGQPGTFIFKIEATIDVKNEDGKIEKKPVYSDVVCMQFNIAEDQTVEIKGKIAINADVEVTEVYSGANYEASNARATAKIKVNEPAVVEFENSSNGRFIKNDSKINIFEYVANDSVVGWDHVNRKDVIASPAK